jgi:hypothetical protein
MNINSGMPLDPLEKLLLLPLTSRLLACRGASSRLNAWREDSAIRSNLTRYGYQESPRPPKFHSNTGSVLSRIFRNH